MGSSLWGRLRIYDESRVPIIDYPFEHELSPKKGGGHITKKEVRQNFTQMYDEVSAFVGESNDFGYVKEILEIIKRHKI